MTALKRMPGLLALLLIPGAAAVGGEPAATESLERAHAPVADATMLAADAPVWRAEAPIVLPPLGVVQERQPKPSPACRWSDTPDDPYSRFELQIDPQGYVVGTRIIETTATAQQQESVAAELESFRFKPFLVDGRLISVRLPHTVVFDDRDDGTPVHCYEAPLWHEGRIDHLNLGDFSVSPVERPAADR